MIETQDNLAQMQHAGEIPAANQARPVYHQEKPKPQKEEAKVNPSELHRAEETKTEESNKLEQAFKFVDKKLMPFTTLSSVIINLISGPVRLFDDDNPLKKFINNISMFFTKSHLLTYATSGLKTAWEQQNPFLLLSYAIEGLAGICGLRQIYLFRGFATAIDGAVGGLKEKFKKANPDKEYKFNSLSEGFNYSVKEFTNVVKEIIAEPQRLARLEGVHTLISSSIAMFAGALWGFTVDDKTGGSVRDFFGGFNDFGLTQIDNATARKSGAFYLMGTAKDFIARFFSETTAKWLGVQDTDKFKRMRDLFHEWALAFDRIGQFFFLRYNQDSGNKKPEQNSREQATSLSKSEPLPGLAFA